MTATTEQLETIHHALHTAIGEIVFTRGAQDEFTRRTQTKDLTSILDVFLDITDEDTVPEGEFYHKDTTTKDFIETVHHHRYHTEDDRLVLNMVHEATAYLAPFGG